MFASTGISAAANAMFAVFKEIKECGTDAGYFSANPGPYQDPLELMRAVHLDRYIATEQRYSALALMRCAPEPRVALVPRTSRDASMIDVYYWTSPNVHKVMMFLEETGLEFKVQPIDVTLGEQYSAGFTAISPNNRLPAIV